LKVSEANLGRHGSELYLALACGAGDKAALYALQTRYFPTIEDYLARSGFDTRLRQDVFQQVLLRLCAGETPTILSYGGRAALSSWLHIAVFRFAITLAGKANLATKHDSELSIQKLASSGSDPETHAMLETAKPMFQAALQRTIAELRDRDKTLLRLSFLDGLSIDAIGAMYGVHRATAARWICDIRQRILLNIQNILGTEFGLRSSEFESLAHLVHAELHLSLSRIFGTASAVGVLDERMPLSG
jgi:RNA polymerase sigma-70 factor (ECF subfamily)